MSKYVYLKHPVDKAEVRKYNAQGLKVLDEKFKPEVEEVPKTKKPRKKAVQAKK